MEKSKIRNFSIVAHIDHGKSTLADRMIEICGALNKREMKTQFLDELSLERERGITIKLNSVKLEYDSKNDGKHFLNLIDTPGHVDFSYEVSRSLAACEGAILVVDATQGVQAQTVANLYLALDNNLEVIPIINKVDLPGADIEKTKNEIEDTLGLVSDDIPLISAKTGKNVEGVLEKIVELIPPPKVDNKKELRALIFDSFYDPYQGAIMSVRVMEGVLKKGDKIKLMSNNKTFDVTSLGIRTPKKVEKESLSSGEVGWVSASIKSVKDVDVGDTITLKEKPTSRALPGYKKLNPNVFCGLYPTDNDKYEDLKDALEKLRLNDSSIVYEPETSQALGFGFRCGFLGMLHMEVIQERLEREFKINLIATAPSVIYEVYLTNGEVFKLENPSKLPEPQKIEKIKEPVAKVKIMTPKEYIGPLMELCQRKRGEHQDLVYVDFNRMEIIYNIPLSELVYDFFDKLKSISRGYASFDYEIIGYEKASLVKMDIKINKETLDSLSIIVHKDFAYYRGNLICSKLKEIIPRQQFEVPIQAYINNKAIARSTIRAMRKDVLSKCYGGDVSRKKKLLEKQKEGKKRMKMVGSVDVPQEAFLAVLSVDDDK